MLETARKASSFGAMRMRDDFDVFFTRQRLIFSELVMFGSSGDSARQWLWRFGGERAV